ncbi:unnamed protein product [Pipistrellus nathusii]|uniref:Secreted protein n=1 Tax=Pipistrellus nathusii TaxID=59473 RepID=A0ABP0AG25_PIPNA
MCVCVCVCVHVCMCVSALLANSSGFLFSHVTLSWPLGLLLYLPVTFPSLLAVNSLGPSLVPRCPLSWGQTLGSGPSPSAVQHEICSAGELPLESNCHMYVTLTRTVP